MEQQQRDPRSVSPHTLGPVCVVGLGLIGGSLLRAIADAGYPAWGWNRSDNTVQAALRDGYDASGDLTATLQRAAQHNALLVVAVPLFAVDDVLHAIAQHAPHCPLTDVVSVKAEVEQKVSEAGLLSTYVGSHPMAGTEFSGWEHTDPTLFRGAPWVITRPTPAPDAYNQTHALATLLETHIVETDAHSHDAAVACISHLPHLLAEALATTAADPQSGGGDLALELAAGSFRDGTRVAGTAPALVRAMCEGNRTALLQALDHTIRLLTQVKQELHEQDTCATLVDSGHAAYQEYQQAQAWRD